MAEIEAPPNTRKYEVGSALDTSRQYRDYDGTIREFNVGPSVQDKKDMLKIDPQASQLSAALRLPVRRAKWDIVPGEGDNGEKEFIEWCLHASSRQGGMTTPIRDVISKMGNAIVYKIAPFEKVWKVADRGPYQGKVILHKIGYRPPGTVKMRTDVNGSFNGFKQEVRKGDKQITATFDPKRALVYIHGSDEEPILGTSPFDVVYNTWKQKLKVSFFFFAFLENVAFPRTIAKVANEDPDALQYLLDKARRLSAQGIIGLYDEETLEAYESQRSSREYGDALEYLDWQMAKACLGQFLDLGTSGERGSYALSQDKINFFYELLDAILQDMANSLNEYLISDLVQYNFGRDAAFPKIKFRPVNDKSALPIIDLYKTVIQANAPNLTPPFLLSLMSRVEEILDLEIDPLSEYDKDDLEMITKTIPTARDHLLSKESRAGAGQNAVTGLDKNANNKTPQSQEPANEPTLVKSDSAVQKAIDSQS
jgi:hypothetical protein